MINKTILLVTGFALTGLGLFALFLMLVSVQVSFLVWLDAAGMLYGFLGRLVLIIAGAVLIVLGVTNWQYELEDIKQHQQALENSPKEAESN